MVVIRTLGRGMMTSGDMTGSISIETTTPDIGTEGAGVITNGILKENRIEETEECMTDSVGGLERIPEIREEDHVPGLLSVATEVDTQMTIKAPETNHPTETDHID